MKRTGYKIILKKFFTDALTQRYISRMFQMFQAAETTSVTLEFSVMTFLLRVLDLPVVRVHLVTKATGLPAAPVVVLV